MRAVSRKIGMVLRAQEALGGFDDGRSHAPSAEMKLGIVGAGSLGGALGLRLARAGHEIMFGGTASALEAAGRQGARVGSNAQAAEFGEIVIFAVPFDSLGAAGAETGSLAGRVVWSCVNALKRDLSGLAVGFTTSGAEQLAAAVPASRLVAAIPPFAPAVASAEHRYDEGLAPTVFLCGDDEEAKRRVAALVRDIGAAPIDVGALAAARLAEPAAMLLVRLAYAHAPRDLALRLMERHARTS